MKWNPRLLLCVCLLLGQVPARAQTGSGVHFSNYFGPGHSLPFAFMGGNGPLLDDHWKAELLVGPAADFLSPVGASVTFWMQPDGEPSGLFLGGTRYQTPVQASGDKILAKVRVWGGADTFDAAWYLVRGETAVFEIPRTGDDAGKLTNMAVPWIGPIQPGYHASSSISLPNQPVMLQAEPFEFPWQPLNRNWQRQDPTTLIWTIIPGATGISLSLEIRGFQDTGWFRLATAVAPDEVQSCSTGCSGAAWVGMVCVESGNLLVKGPPGGRFRVYESEFIAPYPSWKPWLSDLVMGDSSFALPIRQDQPGAKFLWIAADHWQIAPEVIHPFIQPQSKPSAKIRHVQGERRNR